MFLFLAQAVSQSEPQSIIGLIGTIGAASATSGGIITVVVSKMFDTKRIEKIVQLQGKIEALEWRLKHREDELVKVEAEAEELKNQIDALREQSNSSMNTQLLDLREKYENLYATHVKAVKIIKQLKGEKP